MKNLIFALLMILLVCAAVALAQGPEMTRENGFGPDPHLPEVEKSALPTMKVADAVGWPENEKPQAIQGFSVEAFARGLQHPRWLYVLPNGDVLVAETDAPPKKPEGIKGWIQEQVMKKAGSKTKSANRITLLRDADGDGIAETKTAFLENLYSPFGMALVGDQFYVADADAVLVFPYKEGETSIRAPGKLLADLPAGINHHWTKSLVASLDGKYLYVGVGSNSNAAENGIEAETGRAAIQQIDRATGKARIFAFGLRNPVGMDWQPESGALWVSVNERDELGDNLVPDYMTAVKDGAFYGWPYSYYGPHIDTRVEPPNPDLVAKAIPPDYALGAHTASLGLVFYDGTMFPARYKNGAFVGQHGSWNRDPPTGYKVIFIPFENGVPSGMPEEFLGGFLNAKGEAMGRPVGVAVAKDGALLVADDVGNAVWRVSAP